MNIAFQVPRVPRSDIPGYACQLCRDEGWVLVDNRAARCECWKRKQRPYAEGVPAEFHEASLANYERLSGNERALAAVEKFLSGTSDLYLSGGTGAGKTRLACSVLNDHWRKRFSGLFVRVADALKELQPSDEPSALEVKLTAAPLLVLDDLGAEREKATDYTRRTLLMIYEGRGDKGLRTIWTSNLKVGELADMMGDDRLASRIKGRVVGAWIDVADQRGVRR